MANLTFGQAIEAVKEGKLIARKGWNGKGMFVFQRPADTINIDIVLGAKSIPKRVKDYFEKLNQPIVSSESVSVRFSSYLCLKSANDSIVNGWIASQEDIISEDWLILE